MRTLVLAALAACSHADPTPPPAQPVAPAHGRSNGAIDGNDTFGATDVVTALAEDWSSTTVTVSHWRRGTRAAGWERDGAPWQAVIGHAGLAWGAGLHGSGAPEGHAGPVKHEGDGAAPAGAFKIATAFGYDRSGSSKVGYRALTEATECVDDPRSVAYNTLVEHTGSADWASSEHMRRDDELYAIGAVVDHNPKRTPGAGSCIFLHVWSGPDSTTVGCTAMDRGQLQKLLGSLGEAPVFVLLPRAEYRALRDPWGLPPQ